MKTKEQIAKYNKEYFARPEVIARAKERNKKYRERRKLYKKTEKGREAENRYRRKAYHKNLKWDRIQKRYGLSKEDYFNLLDKQKGVCAICGLDKGKPLHIDHNHNTGEVRGLLCSNCNMALGLMKDNVNYLNNAIKYLDYEVRQNNSSGENPENG